MTKPAGEAGMQADGDCRRENTSLPKSSKGKCLLGNFDGRD